MTLHATDILPVPEGVELLLDRADLDRRIDYLRRAMRVPGDHPELRRLVAEQAGRDLDRCGIPRKYEVRTTIAIDVNVLVDVEGYYGDPEELIRAATEKAYHLVDGADIEDLTVKGATARVDTEPLEAFFS